MASGRERSRELDDRGRSRQRIESGRPMMVSERHRSLPVPSLGSMQPDAKTLALEKQVHELQTNLVNMGKNLETVVEQMKGQQSALLAASKAFQSQQVQLNSLQSAAQNAAAQIPAGSNTPVDPTSHATDSRKIESLSSPFSSPLGGGLGFGDLSSAPTATNPAVRIPGVESSQARVMNQAGSETVGASVGLDALAKSDRWLPAMPSVDSSKWRTRLDEILGIESFVENLVSWVGLINHEFAHEIRFSASCLDAIPNHQLSTAQLARGARLLGMLRQIFGQTAKARIILLAYQEKPGPKNGFEALRLIVAEYMLKSRQEILHFRSALVNRTFKAASITELIQNLDYEESRYQKLLAMLPTHLSRDGLLIQSSDFSMILFRSLTGSARDYVMLHSKTDEYVDLKAAALRYESSSRIWTEISGNTNSHYMHSALDGGKKGKGKGKGKKGKENSSSRSGSAGKDENEKEKNDTCFRCGRKGHYKTNCHAKKDSNGKPLDMSTAAKNSKRSDSKEKKGPENNSGGKGKGSGQGKKGTGKGKINELVEQHKEGENPPEGDGTGSSSTDHQPPMKSFIGQWYQQKVLNFEKSLDHLQKQSKNVSFDSDTLSACSVEHCCCSVFPSCADQSFPDSEFSSHLQTDNLFFMPFLCPMSNSNETRCLQQASDSHRDADWWLIDSGASASVVSARFVDRYRIVKSVSLKPNSGPGFSTASGEVIFPTSLVCLRVFFTMVATNDPSKTFLKECWISAFVADAPNNVLSVGNLLRKGWSLGSDGGEVSVHFGNFRLSSVTWQNVPWILHDSKHMPIDVPSDKSLERKSVEKMVNSEELAFEDQPFVMTTKRSADTDIRELDPAAVSSTLNPNPNEVSIRDQLEAERIQFSSEPFDYDFEPNHATEIDADVSNSPFLAGPDDSRQVESGEHSHPSILRKDRKNLDKLQEHRMQGHFPFHPDCLTCAAAKSTSHRRRKRKDAMQSELICDFLFIPTGMRAPSTYKYLILADAITGMRGIAPVETDARSTQQWVKAWLAEFNLVGPSKYPLEILTDAEQAVTALLRGIDVGRALSIVRGAPQAHQSVGAAENSVRVMKEGLATLRQDLRSNGLDINFESRAAINTALAYICFCSNLHGSHLDTKSSPKSLALGRDIKRATGLYGSVVLAEVPKSLKGRVVSRFERAVYLRPDFNSLGDVCCLRVEGEEIVFTAKSIKWIHPLEFDRRLCPSMLLEFDSSRPKDDLQPDPQTLEDDANQSRPKIIPAKSFGDIKNVPAEWIRQHGKTPGCGTCERDSFRSRVHFRKCVDRYIDWLRKQREPSLEVSKHSTYRKEHDSHRPDVRVIELGRESAAQESSISRYPRLRGKQPGPAFLQDPTAQLADGAEPEGGEYSPSILGKDDVPGAEHSHVDFQPDVDMVADQDDVEIDLVDFAEASNGNQDDAMLVDQVTRFDEYELESIENRHVGFMQSVYQVKGSKPRREKADLCGTPIYVVFPGYVISDATGQYLDNELAFKGMFTEVASMTSQHVGKPIPESEAKVLAKKWGIPIISCRWVCVQKDDTNVRMRLVAREVAKGQASARDLMVSSPTSSIESLRIMLATAGADDLYVMGIDVSAAFMASPLGMKLGKPIKVLLKFPPSSMTLIDGSPICLIAEKAINGLRTSGLAWVEHLSHLVQELGLHPSPIEPTVFAGYLKVGKGKTNKLVQIIAYVDDLLVFASSKEEAMIVFNHLANHLRIKQTGEINSSEHGGGSLRFLGRTIERKPSSRTLTVKLDDTYLDSIFESYQISNAASRPPPDLRPILDNESKADPISQEAALKYRAALGKLSWMSQTMVFLCIYCALLATGMAEPTDAHEHAMRAVLRWLRSLKSMQQCFPSPEAKPFDTDSHKLIMYCDASWAPLRMLRRRSISGCVTFYRGSVVKGFSRIQQIVATSSCEAELSALADCMQEAIGLSRISQHFFFDTHSQITSLHEGVRHAEAIHRLINFLFETEHITEERPKVEIECRCDSQAAIRVLSASGLQRRSRHVELRICFCQDLIKKRYIVLTWVEGEEQIADLFTKTLGLRLFMKHLVAMGFHEAPEMPEVMPEKISSKAQSAKKPKGENKIQQQAVSSTEKDVAKERDRILMPAVVFSYFSKECVLIEACEISNVSCHDFAYLVLEIGCESSSHLTKTAFKDLKRGTLIVCCTEPSHLEEYWKDIKICLQDFKKAMKPSYMHISLPCTGGSSLQRLSKNEDLKAEHMQEFLRLIGFCFELIPHVLLWSFELPKRNQYWTRTELQELLKCSKQPLYSQFVQYCQLDAEPISKILQFVSNHPLIVQSLACFSVCSCDDGRHKHFNEINWTNTERYPWKLCGCLIASVKSIFEKELYDFRPHGPDNAYLMWDPKQPEDFRFSRKRLAEFPISAA